MNKHSNALDIDESLKSHFIIGDAFTAKINRVSRVELIGLIEAYVKTYPDTLDDTFTVPTVDDLKSIALVDVLTTFGKLTAEGKTESSDPFTAGRMAAAIFVHLLMLATSSPSFKFESYASLADVARWWADNSDRATIVIDREED